MADNSVLVTASGAALSLLFYENVRSLGDQVGFLLGDTLVYTVKNFTDSDNQVETIKTHINVEAVITCPTTDLFYDATGRINKEKLKNFLSNKSKQVVGWFIFRKDVNLVPTLRDRILHKQFASYSCNGNITKQKLFLTCLMSSSISPMKGTHKFKQVFFRYKRGVFEPIPLRINNLGDGVSKHDGSDYKLTPVRRSCTEDDVFTKLIRTLNLDLTKTQAVASVTAIQKVAEKHLSALIPQVCESDKQVVELERQVKELKAKLLMKNAVNKANVSYNLDMERSDSASSGECRVLESVDSLSSRTDTADNVWDDDRLPKTYEQVPQVALGKAKSTSEFVAKSTSYEKSKGRSSMRDSQSSSQRNDSDGFKNAASDGADSPTNKSRREPSTYISTSEQSINRVHVNNKTVCRGRGNYQKGEGGLKMGKTMSEGKSGAEKVSLDRSTGQGGYEPNCALSSSSACAQMTKNARDSSDTSDEF